MPLAVVTSGPFRQKMFYKLFISASIQRTVEMEAIVEFEQPANRDYSESEALKNKKLQIIAVIR
jgi:hypothetical protein